MFYSICFSKNPSQLSHIFQMARYTTKHYIYIYRYILIWLMLYIYPETIAVVPSVWSKKVRSSSLRWTSYAPVRCLRRPVVTLRASAGFGMDGMLVDFSMVWCVKTNSTPFLFTSK